MIRFFIISLNYPPEPTGFAPKAAAFAEHLARRGHDVHVFTGFAFTPHWSRLPADRGRVFAREHLRGVTVHRLTHFIPRRPSSAIQRVLMEGTFAIAAIAPLLATLLARGRPTAVMYIGAQPALAMLARMVSAVLGRPYFVNVTDLAAQAALDVGIVGRRVSRVLEALEFWAYRGAASAFVLCRSFEDSLVAHGYPSDRIHLIRDPTDLEVIRPVSRTDEFRHRHGIPADAFVIMHAGSMGMKTGLMSVVQAATLARDPRVCWVLVGTGEAMPSLLEAVHHRNLTTTVRFVPFEPANALSQMFASADVLLLNQIAAMKDTVIPSKLLTYMASGRPVLAAVNPASQAADILREAAGGVLVPAEDAAALAGAADELARTDTSTLAAFGARNRSYAERHFDQRRILRAHEDGMLKALGTSIGETQGL